MNADAADAMQATRLIVAAMRNMEARLAALETLTRDVQQTVNMAALRPVPNKRRARCLFLIHYVESWDTYADIVDAMRAAEDFDPVVATVHRLAGQPQRYDDEQINHDELTRLGVPHIRLNMEDSYQALQIIKAMQPDIIFRQAPWDATLPPAFAASELTFARLCYVPYSFMAMRRYSSDEDPAAPCSKLQTDQPFHRLCWRIFCETEMHREMFRQTAARGDANVVCCGYPKFDRLLQARHRPPVWPITGGAGGGKPFRLIWAPHHTVTGDWLNFGMFPDMYRDMLAWAREDAEVEIVLKPHPALFSKLIDSGIMSVAAVQAFLADWKSLPNAALVEGADYGPLFCASDAMLTDGVGFLFEYPLFEKPLIFLDKGSSVGFNAAGAACIEAANTVKTFEEARTLCAALRRGTADPKAAIRQQVLQRLRPYPDQSASMIVDAIRAGLRAEAG